MEHSNTSFVLFGITGDLARQKLIPSLYKLFVRGMLPSQFSLVGFGRKEYSIEQFRVFIEEIVKLVHLPEELVKMRDTLVAEFTLHCFYIQGQLDHGIDYENLKRHLDQLQVTRTYFYLSVPPSHHHAIIEQLGWVQLLKQSNTYVPYLMIEKPFGEDETSAKELDHAIKKYLAEENIYRIDHYLGKDMLHKLEEDKKNILFSHVWNDGFIEQIHAYMHEQKDVGSRGAFYDQVGALTDVGQNHVLQMLSAIMVLTDPDHTADHIMAARAKVLSSLEVIQSKVERGQYEGYRQTAGVDENSMTETFFKAELKTSLPKWKKTKLIVSAGKAIADSSAALVITFRPAAGNKKKPGQKLVIELNTPHLVPLQRMDAYEHILVGALEGDRSMFISLAEAVAGWKFVRIIRNVWKKKKTPLKIYKPHTQV